MLREDFERENEQQTAMVTSPPSTFRYTTIYILDRFPKIPCKSNFVQIGNE